MGSRDYISEEKISVFKDRSIEIIQFEKQGKKRNGGGKIRTEFHPNICVIEL